MSLNRSSWFTRNPVKVLHPYSNQDGFRIENHQLEKAANFLRQSGYSVQFGSSDPGQLKFEVTDILYSTQTSNSTTPITFSYTGNNTPNIVTPTNNALLRIYSSNGFIKIHFYFNNTSNQHTEKLSKNNYYSIFPSNGNTQFWLIVNDTIELFNFYMSNPTNVSTNYDTNNTILLPETLYSLNLPLN